MSVLRPATSGDLPFVKALLDAPGNLDKLANYTLVQLEGALSGDGRIWVYGAQEGFAYLSGFETNPPALKIEEFAAASPGTGSGARMMAALLETLRRDYPGARLWLLVAADNAGAIRFYERFGFAASGTLPGLWHRRAEEPAVPLRMDLPAPM